MSQRPFGMDEPAHVDAVTHAQGLRALAGVGGALVVAAVLPYLVPGLERCRVWLPDEPVPVVRLFAPSEDEVEVVEAPIDGTDPLAAALEEPVIPPPPSTSAAADETPRVRIDPSELQGLVREIEDPSGHAMDAFYAQLERTALSSVAGSGHEGVVTRIAHFGDSTIALDGITMTTRESLQLRFGDAGHGFVLAARGLLPYRHF